MPDKIKSEKILDALQQLLEEKSIQHISVSEIAAKAGIGKGSIYYYFPSKDAIVDALIERSYEMPLDTAKNLSTDGDDVSGMPQFFRSISKAGSCVHGKRAGSGVSPPEIFKLSDLGAKARPDRYHFTGHCMRRNLLRPPRGTGGDRPHRACGKA